MTPTRMTSLRQRVRMLLAGRRASVFVRSVGYLLIFAGFLWALQGGLLPGLWLVLIGWLLTRLARSSYNTGRFVALLDGLTVGDALEADPAGIAPTLLLDTLMAEDARQTGGSGVYAVRQDGRLLGVVDVIDADGLPRASWPATPVSAIMRPLADLDAVPPDQPLLEVVARFEQSRREAFAVVDGGDGRFLGFVTRERVHQLMRSRVARDRRERERARAAGR